MSLEEMNKIDELKEQGRSLNEIAEQLKRNKPTVTAYLNEEEEDDEDTVEAMEEEEDGDEEDVMEDDLEVGDIRLGEEGYFNDFGASTSHQPVEAEGSQASKADGMDEYEEGDYLGVGDVRREFKEDVDNFGASRCSEPADAVREEPEVAEGHDESEDTDDDEDVRDERRVLNKSLQTEIYVGNERELELTKKLELMTKEGVKHRTTLENSSRGFLTGFSLIKLVTLSKY